MDDLEFALEKIGSTRFEQLAAAYLRLQGYDVHESGHSAADGGWDARVSINGQDGIAHASVRSDWRQKIREDAESVSDLEKEKGDEYDLLVFVTNQKVTGQQELDMEKEIREEYGWDLRIEQRATLLGEIRTNHAELANEFLGVDLDTSRDQLDELLELRDERIELICDREGAASDLQLGPTIALHVIPTGIFSQRSEYSGQVPDPPVLWKMTTPRAEIRGKESFAQDTGRDRRDTYRSYGLLRNNGLYESAKNVGFYQREDEVELPLNVSPATPGFDAYVVITARRALQKLNKMAINGSALVSVSILDAPQLKGNVAVPGETRLSNFTMEIGEDRYVTDPVFVDIEEEPPLHPFEELLDEIWRQLGRPGGTENIEEGEWVGGNVHTTATGYLLGGEE